MFVLYNERDSISYMTRFSNLEVIYKDENISSIYFKH